MMMLRFTSQISLILLVLLCAVTFNRIFCCHERDRSLLLIFKQGVVDPSSRLSSWSTQQDCCEWHGVLCDLSTRRVTNLFLQNQFQNGSESLGGEINLPSLLELEFLQTLDLSFNDFQRISMPSINTSALVHSHLPANFSKLYFLRLSHNDHLRIDNLHWLSRLPSLTSLDLSGIHLPMEKNWVQSLASLHLERLYLRDCQLTSFILSIENANFSSLLFLDLGLNDFRHGLPKWLFNLSSDLYYIDLRQCNVRGQIPDFSAYRNLHILELSNNTLTGSIPDWLGQLARLTGLNLSMNWFHSSIPSSLGNLSTLSYLDISFNQLSGTLPKALEQTYVILGLSHNSIGGDISNLLLTSDFVLMSYNKFEGQLPRISSNVIALDLAYNSFSGSLSSLLCHTESDINSLLYLDTSNNFLSEELPACWSNWPRLSYIYLGSNKLAGEVPPSMGSSLLKLRSLDLHNNSFSGDIPWTFQTCTSLVLINLEGNNFAGTIPIWMQQSVAVLKLRSNQFVGNIPPEICNLSNLIVLDVANNKLSGSIPSCLHNLTSLVSGLLNNALISEGADLPVWVNYPTPYEFKIDLNTKGQELKYEKNLKLVRSIDLSSNKLSGEIPVQLFGLNMLQSLNLSYNHLTGGISERIGEMKFLESLDFSHNSLHGNIPQSLSTLSFLSVLNLSYNYFIGQIPLGTQLQSFDVWSYTGNPELCGAPLQKKCTIERNPNNTIQLLEGNDDDTFLKSLYLGMGVGFAVGFWTSMEAYLFPVL
ncbi:receptor-like protein EIX1 [Neltuma alba]|uniref:receptor-like protein EIX1 n=1 Tax=Neltuma alba TaxID=207710 RepID=UPI0010A4CB1C|nr:receptor-like protein EIX1 [Prosopis alba]